MNKHYFIEWKIAFWGCAKGFEIRTSQRSLLSVCFHSHLVMLFDFYFSIVLIGPYNTSDFCITIVVVFLINIVVPLLYPYCYYCAP